MLTSKTDPYILASDASYFHIPAEAQSEMVKKKGQSSVLLTPHQLREDQILCVQGELGWVHVRVVLGGWGVF